MSTDDAVQNVRAWAAARVMMGTVQGARMAELIMPRFQRFGRPRRGYESGSGTSVLAGK